MIDNDITCKSKFTNRQKKFIKKRSQVLLASVAAGLVFLGGATSVQAISPEAADINDNGRVDIRDMRKLLSKRGVQSGELGYLEGLDLVPDSVIDSKDVMAIRSNYRQTADTGNTTVNGRIFDVFLNPLAGVKVFVGSMTIDALLAATCAPPLCAVTNAAGQYSLDVPEASTGETAISFVGNAVVDSTSGELSGQFATVPFKPIFINGGRDNTFRDMIVPERNLMGSTDLTTSTATNNGGNSFTLNDPLVVGDPNGIAVLKIPAGCTVNIPVGELPVVSYTAVPADTLPVAMPPGISTTTPGTFQPAESEVDCPVGVQLTAEIDNLDGYNRTPTTPLTPQQELERPIFSGVSDGVYQEITRCNVVDVDLDGIEGDVQDVIQCDVPTPYLFAWHMPYCNPDTGALDCVLCASSTITGTVKEKATNIPIEDAAVTIPGIAPVATDASGNFTIVGVPPGPNGPFCDASNGRFSARATATGNPPTLGGTDTSISQLIRFPQGASVNVGTIFLGDPKGTVQGRMEKLSRINPVLIDPLAAATINIGALSDTTDAGGNYTLTDVPLGTGSISANFTGDVNLPGRIDEDPVDGIDNDLDGNFDEDTVDGVDNDMDSVVPKTITVTQGYDATDPNVPNMQNIRVTGAGTINVTFNNVPAGYTIGRAFSNGGTFNGNFFIQTVYQTDSVDDQPNNSTTSTFSVPMGPCRISIIEPGMAQERLAFEEIDGCFINEDGQVLTVVVDVSDYQPPQPKQFSGAFAFFAIGSIGLGAAATRRRRVYLKLK